MVAQQQPATGRIEPDCLYTLSAFREATGLGEAALRTLRRQGLKVHRAGGRAFVLGREAIEILTMETDQ
jgi:hypothetical protein